MDTQIEIPASFDIDLFSSCAESRTAPNLSDRIQMPELPEVEVLRRHLSTALVGRTISRVQVLRPRTVQPSTSSAQTERLSGFTVRSVDRRGKFLMLRGALASGRPESCTVHLGMTGRVYVADASTPLAKHLVVACELEGEGPNSLRFEDVRGFGFWRVGNEHEPRLGPEPWDPHLTPERLHSQAQQSRQAIKTLLLDQQFIAGVGNIYASEALFRSRIHPETRGCQFSTELWGRLLEAVQATLSGAIELGLQQTLDWEGRANSDGLFYFGNAAPETGASAERFLVYDRAGQPCSSCASPIQRSVQAQRSTYFCPQCQPSFTLASPGTRQGAQARRKARRSPKPKRVPGAK